MKQSFTASVWQEGEWYVAQCMQVDVASQGSTECEALDNLRDALELHFTPPVATLIPHLHSIAIDMKVSCSPWRSVKSSESWKQPALWRPDKQAATSSSPMQVPPVRE